MNDVLAFNVQPGKSRVFFDYCKLNDVITVFSPYFINGFVQISHAFARRNGSEKIELFGPEIKIRHRYAQRTHLFLPRINFAKKFECTFV